ncbi:type II secretion system protein [Fastidiosibacter lacustris]|uniref:type II secretion system protein n=1 Tax=Fastidiosibacter lacustris TaxID=2056695 RepID=UPI000E35129C|nr:type II secretion system protein [Fastidiosibacter lacustris]
MKYINQQQTQHINLKKQRGITMVELLIGISVIAIIAVLILTYASGLWSDVKVKQTKDAVSTMSSKLVGIYAATTPGSAGRYDGISTADAFDLVPSNLIRGTGTNRAIITPWTSTISTSEITVAPYNSNIQFGITLTDIPAKACRDIGADYLGGYADEVLVGTEKVTKVSELTAKCNGNDNGNGTLVLVFS